MYKLNRKGFTLIELLAVIVVLAIILVVTIPSVLSSMNKAKNNQLQNAADSVAEWFNKQYEAAKLGTTIGGADVIYTTWLESIGGTLAEEDYDIDLDPTFFVDNVKKEGPELLQAAGLNVTQQDINFAGSFIWYDTLKSRVCVRLSASEGGRFYDTSQGAENSVKSSGCN